MANDPPTNLRMGFGFEQARAAGAPYVAPRPVSRVNWEIKCRQCAKKLRELAIQESSVGKLVREIMEARKVQGLTVCSAVELYHVVLFNRPHLAPSGYWDYAQKTYGWLRPKSN
jgi:hypothetical protein